MCKPLLPVLVFCLCVHSLAARGEAKSFQASLQSARNAASAFPVDDATAAAAPLPANNSLHLHALPYRNTTNHTNSSQPSPAERAANKQLTDIAIFALGCMGGSYVLYKFGAACYDLVRWLQAHPEAAEEPEPGEADAGEAWPAPGPHWPAHHAAPEVQVRLAVDDLHENGFSSQALAMGAPAGRPPRVHTIEAFAMPGIARAAAPIALRSLAPELPQPRMPEALEAGPSMSVEFATPAGDFGARAAHHKQVRE